jgi:hypothetical protein
MSEEQKKNKIYINDTPVTVTAKRLTFFDVQKVAPLFTNVGLDFSSYWRHAFSHWLSYEPSIDIDTLSPTEGQELMSMLPEPTQIMDWLLFRPAKSVTSNSSYTEELLASGFATNEKGWSIF